MPASEIVPVCNRPLSSVRDERSLHNTSFPVASVHEQRESKCLPSLNTFKTSSPHSLFPPERSEILFYHSHKPYYGFTNFSNHPIIYKGKKYPTSEHLFQSFKFQDHKPDLAEHIRTCSERPSVAFSEARRFQPEVRPDWKEVNISIMDFVLQLKFNQHYDLRQELLGTANASLIEDSDKDAFWGIGHDRKGRNELGKALERLRAKLRTASYSSTSPATHNDRYIPSNAAHKTERDQSPGHNVNTLSPIRHNLQLRDTRSQVHATYSSSQNMVQSPTQTTHSSPYLGHNAKPPNWVSPSFTQSDPHFDQTTMTQSMTRNNQSSAYNPHISVQDVPMRGTQSPIMTVQAPQQNRPLTEQNPASYDESLKPPSYDTIESISADITVKCRIPDCEKPVYYDGTLKSDYCSQQHRQEAVSRGLTDSCIKCRKMPQSEMDYFCGRGCREESLNKNKIHPKI